MTTDEILTLLEALSIADLHVIRQRLPAIIIAKANAERHGKPVCGHPRSYWKDEQDRKRWYCPDCFETRTEYHTRRG